MKTENVQELFRIKLDMEMKQFEQNILKGTVEEVFNSACEIQMKKTIYECLWEVSQKLGISVLEKLLLFPNLLAFLYMRWLKVEDEQWNILSEFLGDEGRREIHSVKKLVSTLNLSKAEWLQYRKKGIGGSDAGAVCGLNPYVSVMDVYLDKINSDVVS